MLITSPDNSTVKMFAGLKNKKLRMELGRYLIEGYRAVKDSLRFIADPMIMFSQSAYEKYASEFEGVRFCICDDNVFCKLSDTENSQGIICSANIPHNNPDFVSRYALLLDRIRDPGNMGTIIRTALAAGFSDIYCLNCVDAYNPKVVRSAMSAISRVNIFDIDIGGAEEIKSAGYIILAADMSGENVFSSDITGRKLCLAIGNEANGLSEGVITMSDKVLCLPMCAGESLNAGVSAAVLMYELAFGRKNISV
mgnify:CR=1 FL=1|jgi:tRNA/rRNA methyltransferase